MTTTDPHTAINDTETTLIKGGMDPAQVARVVDVLRAVADGTDTTEPLAAMSIPAQRTGPNPMVAGCTGDTAGACPWTGNRFDAALHEGDMPGHRVTVWNTAAGELYPRSMWAVRPTFPQAT